MSDSVIKAWAKKIITYLDLFVKSVELSING